jgi:exopolysaccharide biosynthesis WecB/TagA/CpsF family protein
MTSTVSDSTIVVGGIPIGVHSRHEWAERIVSAAAARASSGQRPTLIYAANGQVVYLYATDPAFRAQFRQADAVTADGQPIVWASRLTQFPLPERAATTDLIHDVAHAAQRDGRTFFLLGSSEANNVNAAEKLQALYPGLRIVGRRNGYFSRADEAGIIQTLRDLKPDILWVGLGVKMQLDFVTRNAAALDGVGCIVTCGGLFDYFSARIKRAPLWMQNHSLEWLFRAWQEPRKYVLRYLVTNPVATLLLLTRTQTARTQTQ